MNALPTPRTHGPNDQGRDTPAPSAPQDQPETPSQRDAGHRPKRRNTHRINLLAAVLSLATAILGVVAGALGVAYNTESSKNTDLRRDNLALQESLSSERENVASLTGANDTLRTQNSEQAARVAELLAQLPPQPPSGENIPQVRKAGTITMAIDGDSIDLNSTAVNWNAGSRANLSTSDELTLTSNGLQFTTSGMGLISTNIARVRLHGKASYAPCAVASGYAAIARYTYVNPQDLEDGRTCFRLTTNRYATIIPTAVSSTSVTLAITVWENP